MDTHSYDLIKLFFNMDTHSYDLIKWFIDLTLNLIRIHIHMI
jgi:hypothetical protein